MNIKECLEAISREFEITIHESENKGTGMQVPFHGDFAGALRVPSIIGRMRWWVREFNQALIEDDDKEKIIEQLKEDNNNLINDINQILIENDKLENIIIEMNEKYE